MTTEELMAKIKSGEYDEKIQKVKEAAKKRWEELKAAIIAKNKAKQDETQ